MTWSETAIAMSLSATLIQLIPDKLPGNNMLCLEKQGLVKTT